MNESEEDEKMLNLIIARLHSHPNVDSEEYSKEYHWLNKRYNTWKPSDEQIKGIECAIKTLRFQLNVGDKRLNSLYDALKKLKE